MFVCIRNVDPHAPVARGRAGTATIVSVGAPAVLVCAGERFAKCQKMGPSLVKNVHLSGRIEFSFCRPKKLVRCAQANIMAARLGNRDWLMLAANFCLEAESYPKVHEQHPQ